MSLYQNIIKPFADFGLALVLVIFLSPVILGVYLLLLIPNSGRAFFFQRRPGKDEHIFTIVKFKTMNDRKDANGNLLPDEERLTTVGKFVRKTSLDELPQLFNVLKGDMSLVGSRPFPVEESKKFDYTHMKRLSIKPGITGMAQIRGRSNLSFYRWVRWDFWYIDNWSFGLDLKILLWTIQAVLKREGAY